MSIIDYGMGNIQSLINAFDTLGVKCQLVNNINFIKETDICIMPGVGSFPEGMKQLHNLNLVNNIRDYCFSGGALIGICLGMQLLLSKGTEYKTSEGLGIVKGVVKKLPNLSYGLSLIHI